MPKQGRNGPASKGKGATQALSSKIRKPSFKTGRQPAKSGSLNKAEKRAGLDKASAKPMGKVKPKLGHSLASKTLKDILELQEKEPLLKLVDQLNKRIQQIEQEGFLSRKKHKKTDLKKVKAEVMCLVLRPRARANPFNPADNDFALRQASFENILDLSDALPQILVQLSPRALIKLSMVSRKAKSLVDDAPQNLGLWYFALQVCRPFLHLAWLPKIAGTSRL